MNKLVLVSPGSEYCLTESSNRCIEVLNFDFEVKSKYSN